MTEPAGPGVSASDDPAPIAGVPTSVAAFVGETERGPLRPRLVTSARDYERWFGGPFAAGRFMPQAVAGFFENGGTRLYVARVVGAGATTASRAIGGIMVRAAGPGRWGRRVWVRVLPSSGVNDAGTPIGFRLRVAYWSSPPVTFFDPFDDGISTPRPQCLEEFDDLAVARDSPNYFELRLAEARTAASMSALVTLEPATPDTLLAVPAATTGVTLDGDGDGDDGPESPAADDYRGDEDAATARHAQGLALLRDDAFRDVALVYAPFPAREPDAVARAVVEHCERERFRFGIVDGPATSPAGLRPRQAVADSSYAATYAPWIAVAPAGGGPDIRVPPGGHVAGIYARTDLERGVFKAPANAVVRGALDVQFRIDDAAQAVVNAQGVNTIRVFPSRGILVWGSRTLSSDSAWKYVSIRRLFIFLEHSIEEGTAWVVFEPNGDRLWRRVVDVIRAFLRIQWRAGALAGVKEEEAFFVKCDRSTMTQDDIDDGRLVCHVGVAPVRPAEFIVFRLSRLTADSRGA